MMEFFQENAQYIVLGITLLIWIGISVYLLSIDSKLSVLEKKFEDARD
ncbi:MAG: CcmD family protein [Bacteroidota bacterium]|nr:CcmD family protein [Bacteroidota bacterium]